MWVPVVLHLVISTAGQPSSDKRPPEDCNFFIRAFVPLTTKLMPQETRAIHMHQSWKTFLIRYHSTEDPCRKRLFPPPPPIFGSQISLTNPNWIGWANQGVKVVFQSWIFLHSNIMQFILFKLMPSISSLNFADMVGKFIPIKLILHRYNS